MSWGYANRLEAQLREEVKTLLEQAARADTEASPGLDIPEELARRESRLAAIGRAKTELERRAQERDEAEQAEYEEKLKRRRDTEKATGKKARGREPKAPEPGPRAKDQVNFTDEQSRIMPSSQGFVQAYNAQAAVDIDSHLVVAEHVSNHTNDKQELAPALRCLDEREEVVGQPQALLADAGYFSDENVKRCEAEGIEPYIASGRERHHQPLAERFESIPEGPAQPDGVPAMVHRMKTPEGRALYAKRKSTVETVFGVVKEVMGFPILAGRRDPLAVEPGLQRRPDRRVHALCSSPFAYPRRLAVLRRVLKAPVTDGLRMFREAHTLPVRQSPSRSINRPDCQSRPQDRNAFRAGFYDQSDATILRLPREFDRQVRTVGMPVTDRRKTVRAPDQGAPSQTHDHRTLRHCAAPHPSTTPHFTGSSLEPSRNY